MCKNFYYLHNQRPIIVMGKKTVEGSWYLPQLDISEHELNLFEDVFDFYHSRLVARPTKVSHLWIIDGAKL